MKRSAYHTILLAFAGACFLACENKDYLYRDVSSRISLSSERIRYGNSIIVTDSLRFSFMLLDPEETEETVYFVAHLSGQAAAADREFRLEVVAEQTNVSPSDYTLGATVLPAGKFEVLIPVHVKRNVPGLDLTNWQDNVTARLHLRFVPNENFLAAAQTTQRFLEFTVIWCDFLTKPESWSYWIEQAIGPFSQARYKFFVDFTGETEFTRYDANSTTRSALQAALRKALQEYNDLADAEGRPRYKNDDGSDLTF